MRSIIIVTIGVLNMIIRELSDDTKILLEVRLSNQFNLACKNGDLETVKGIYFKNSVNSLKKKVFFSFRKIVGMAPIKLDPNYPNNTPFLTACENNHYNIVEFFLKDIDFSNELKRSSQKNTILNVGLSSAVANGNIEMIKLILPLIENRDFNFYSNLLQGFMQACYKNDIQVCNFILLESSINPPHLFNLNYNDMSPLVQKNNLVEENKEKYQVMGISFLKNKGFLAACHSGSLDIIKYFTDSHKSNCYIDVNEIFKEKNNNVVIEKFDVIEYFIMNLNLDEELFYRGNIEISPDMEDYEIRLNQVGDLFEKRKLFTELNTELDSSVKKLELAIKKKPKL